MTGGAGGSGTGRGDSCSFTLSRGPDRKPITVLITGPAAVRL
jgi:hypothetical protein